MQKNLVIVESPAKAKTIEKFLGPEYKVLSSYGHIRDLKKKDLGIDIENGFTPLYEVPEDKAKVVAELRKQAKSAQMVWLASDEDREGEAIAWHLYEVLGLNSENTKRIVFHEITKSAIINAIENPRTINIDLVNAQQARRVLDRIVGFELSPILWRKIKSSLSAGRVQSVTVRLVVEREREIQNFKSEASYRIIGTFLVPTPSGEFVELKAELPRRPKTKVKASEFLELCRNSEFAIQEIITRPARKSPAAPFTTSTLQQEASRKLGFSVSQTMSVAQKLYENGHITYMRTDSVNLSDLAINTAKAAIIESMGEQYWQYRKYQTKAAGAQEAHEAIRPTYMNKSKIDGTAQEKRLYDLIWKRTIASQMADAQLEKTTVNIAVGNSGEDLVAQGEVLKFDGFLRVYMESNDDENDQTSEEGLLPAMAEGQVLSMNSIVATERYSQRPPRYSEASLVRKLEELGIGRPSTYAPTISTVQQRGYVEKGDKPGIERQITILNLSNNQISESVKTEISGADRSKLYPTNIGIVVNDYLMESFPDILNYSFTANVEKEFDSIAEGDLNWVDALGSFYSPFHKSVELCLESKQERRVGERVLGVDPKTNKIVSVRIGRYGPMVQIGTPEDEDKPLFKTLQPGLLMESITLEEALKHFEEPAALGEYEGVNLTIGAGRFGPYIKFGSTFVSIPKAIDPKEITHEQAIALIEDKRKKEAERVMKTFQQEPELEIQKGRFGPFIFYKGANYKLPKDVEPLELTFEECMKIVESQPGKPSKRAAAKSSTSSTKKSTSTAKKSKEDSPVESKTKKSSTTAKKSTTTKSSTAKKSTAKKAKTQG
ncbi:MAG: type I DNA topoisomerase [Bacteroidales bacterium]